jgi:hypothetical protein
VDDALQLYNRAVENWRDQEDIAAILRDREILSVLTYMVKPE